MNNKILSVTDSLGSVFTVGEVGVREIHPIGPVGSTMSTMTGVVVIAKPLDEVRSIIIPINSVVRVKYDGNILKSEDE